MQKKSISKISIIAASALTLGTCLPAGIAFADPDPVDPPSVGDQSGAGSTAMTMVWEDSDQEYGGNTDPNNPPSDPNDPTSPGENLAFKAPTAINFVAKANGDLLAPSYSAVYLENFSSFGIHVSSMQIEQGSGWNIVENAAASSNTANAVWGKIGPYNEKLNWYDHKIKADVTTASKWGMAAAGAANNQSKLFLATEGKFANLNIDLSEAKTFGTIHWYLKMGGEGQPAVDPSTIHGLNKPTTTSAKGSFKLKSSPSAAASEDLGEAAENDVVYIVAEPTTGYAVDEMSVTKVSDNSAVTVTPDSQNDNIGSFTMPDEAVDVAVKFKSTVDYGTAVQSWDAGVVPNTVTATLYDSGTMVISGAGAMNDYSFGAAPWAGSRNSVTAGVVEPDVTSIGNYAFEGCYYMTSISIPSSVTSIGEAAFNGAALTTVTIPDGVSSIGEKAFSACSQMQTISIPNSVNNIGGEAFQGCRSLTSFSIPNGITSIEQRTFCNCSSLTSITIPDSVTSIGEWAFGNTGFTSFTVPENVTTIERQAFSTCSSLTSITLPAGVTSIGIFAFEKCPNLTTINAGFAQDAVSGAPWSASNATINYNYAG